MAKSKENMGKKPSVLIGVPTLKEVNSRFFGSFMTAIAALLSDQSFKDWQIHFAVEHSNFTHSARNRLIKKALQVEADFLIMVDDDMILPAYVFIGMLTRHLPFLALLAYRKYHPHAPVVGIKNQYGKYQPLTDCKNKGLMEVDAVGFGCVCMATEALKKIDPPWCFPIGEEGEDYDLCEKLKSLGVPIIVDTDTTAGHIGESIIDSEGAHVL